MTEILNPAEKTLPDPTEDVQTTPQLNRSNARSDDRNDHWSEDVAQGPNFSSLVSGWDGKFVMVFGVLIPALIFLGFTVTCIHRLILVVFAHPLETLAELVLVAEIPTAIFFTWRDLRQNISSYSLLRGIRLGTAIGASLVVAGISLFASGTFVDEQIGGNLLPVSLLLPSVLAAIAGALVMDRVRCTRDFASSRARIVGYTCVGVALSLLICAGAEAKPWFIRTAERMAISASATDQKEGLARLRWLCPEREMRIECSDGRAAGLCGLFLPLTTSAERELYFALTGEPFSFRDVNNQDLSSLSDESLSRQFIGEQVGDLTLLRSALTGVIHPETLTSTISWTFVYKNDATQLQDARAQIAIPHGAVLTKLTVWNKGEPRDANFSNAARIDYSNLFPCANGGKQICSMIKGLGQGRLFFACCGIPEQSEIKVRLTFVVPLKPDNAGKATLLLPKFVSSNFDLTGEHQVRLRASLPFGAVLARLKSSRSNADEYLVTGTLQAEDLSSSGLILKADRPENSGRVAILDKSPVSIGASENRHPTKTSYVMQSALPVPAAIPSQLVMVIDGSAKLNKYRQELAKTLMKLPPNLRASVILVSNPLAGEIETLSPDEAIKSLNANEFTGGQDNLKAMIKATEIAGESTGGAVLWIHGPQPASNREIYIMGQYQTRPRFYDFSVENGNSDTNEFFRNYSEIGPFEEIPRIKTISSDLGSLLSRWTAGSTEYNVAMTSCSVLAPGTKLVSDEAAQELLTLWTNQLQLAKEGSPGATKSEHDHPSVTTAFVRSGQDSSNYNDNNYQVHGGPQGSNANYIPGVNTAGTARVNNLANLEAFLNIIANGCEIGGFILGIIYLAQALKPDDESSGTSQPVSSRNLQFSRGRKLALGLTCIIVGLAIPGAINGLVASARDANLFS
jgi:hypothetical protein